MAQRSTTLFSRVKKIIEAAQVSAARSVNTAQVVAYWLVGQEIVLEEQKGRRRADYGQRILSSLSSKMTEEIGSGFSVSNLKYMRQFFLSFPELVKSNPIGHALRDQLKGTKKGHALSGESANSLLPAISEQKRAWTPGTLHSDLSWTHYRALLKLDKADARAFYQIEAIKNAWNARELERQINSLLYERLALSKDKKGLLKLRTQGHEVRAPRDLFKDPMVIEFLGLPESPKISETDLEEALINNLQKFLLELGKGFAFVSRQERLTLDGDHFYIDLIFYHTVLRCYILIEIKTKKLTHQDLGQLQFYVNYFDRERKNVGDNPTLGLILCTDKNDTVVKYTLAEEQRTIFASRYKLHLPTEAELKAEIKRELKELAPGTAAKSNKGAKR